MVRVKIFNGLGNQMFQYACARSVQEKHGGELYLDISDFATNKREYGLKNYKLNGNIKVFDKDLSFFNLRNNIILKVCCKKMPKLIYNVLKKWGKYLYLLEDYVEIDKNNTNNYYLYGYWQSEKYFESIKPMIKEEFTLKEEVKEEHKKIINDMINTNSVAVHIRRGDYINNKHYKDICNDEYYKNAIETIKNKVNNPVFYIFSDEIEWIKANLKLDEKVYFIDGNNKDYEELNLMTYCKHYIIANSSFSWWGQYLSRNTNKIVIAPKKWNNNKCKADIYMKDWIII